jgi:hypothetical protein
MENGFLSLLALVGLELLAWLGVALGFAFSR